MSPCEAIRGRVFAFTHTQKTDQLGLCSQRGAGVTVRISTSRPPGRFTARFTPFLSVFPRCIFFPALGAWSGNSKQHKKAKTGEERAEESLQQADMKDKVKRGGGKLLPKSGERSVVSPLSFPPLCLSFFSLSFILFHTPSLCCIFLLFSLKSPRLQNALSFCSVTHYIPFHSFYFLPPFLTIFVPLC